jgi:uncharacterized protein YjiS (DUF1127 family)
VALGDELSSATFAHPPRPLRLILFAGAVAARCLDASVASVACGGDKRSKRRHLLSMESMKGEGRMDGSAWVDRRRDATARDNPLARVIKVVSVWRARARERCCLAALTERDLRDIGISRVEQRRECDKPFWCS